MKLQWIVILMMSFLMSSSSSAVLRAESEPAPGVVAPVDSPEMMIGELGWVRGKPGYSAAIKKLAKTQKPFIIYIINGACVENCNQFEELVLSDPEIVKYLEEVDRVVIDVDQSVKLGKRFGMTEFPNLLVMRTTASAQRVGLPRDEEGVPQYDNPGYMLKRIKRLL